MPLFIADWDKQDGNSAKRIYVIDINIEHQTVVALVDKKLVFNIPATQVTWDHWANG